MSNELFALSAPIVLGMIWILYSQGSFLVKACINPDGSTKDPIELTPNSFLLIFFLSFAEAQSIVYLVFVNLGWEHYATKGGGTLWGFLGLVLWMVIAVATIHKGVSKKDHNAMTTENPG